MRGVILFSLMVAIGWAVADDAKPKGKPVRVIAAWERLPGSGEFQPSLVRGSDDLWHVRGEKAPPDWRSIPLVRVRGLYKAYTGLSKTPRE